MKKGILIPTRGDRKIFLDFAFKQLERQTDKNFIVEVVDFAPKSSAPDITERYRVGCEKLISRGCELIFPWEDDDYYKPNYVERMYQLYKANGSPQIFGINSTIYYNIFTRKWAKFEHNGRASMMNTVLRADALKNFKWCDDSESFVDMYLWRKLRGRSVAHAPLCIGIKHGIGLCGGGGHTHNWHAFQHSDQNFSFLRQHVGADLSFYSSISVPLATEIKTVRLSPRPFLSIITRVMEGKRNGLFEKHRESIRALNTFSFEQIFIIDRAQQGLHVANRNFQLAKPIGDYVYLLDDDDFFTRRDAVYKMFDSIYNSADAPTVPNVADVLFFKMKIKTGDGDEMYPKKEIFGKIPENFNSWRGRIGGSCFIVKRWVFEKYIRYFDQPSFGDWHFITKVLSDPEIKVRWLDVQLAETGKVSRGKPE